jgi:hypothetical protein
MSIINKIDNYISEEKTCNVCGHNPAAKGKKVCRDCQEEMEDKYTKQGNLKNKKKTNKNATIDVDKLKPER